MNALRESVIALEMVYAAKDAAIAQAIARVDRKFAPIMLECQMAYKQAQESRMCVTEEGA